MNFKCVGHSLRAAIVLLGMSMGCGRDDSTSSPTPTPTQPGTTPVATHTPTEPGGPAATPTPTPTPTQPVTTPVATPTPTPTPGGGGAGTMARGTTGPLPVGFVFARGGASPGAPCGGTVLCVDSAAAPGGDGSAGSPLRSVQAAIAAAADGSTIQVRAGTYDENVAVVDKTVILHGGFPAAGDFSQRDPAANPTILGGIGGDSVVTLLRAGATVVDGFVITNGTGKPATDQSEGGGVYVMGGSTTISNNLIENNSTDAGVNDSAGGGIFVQSAAGFSIEGNIIRNNVSSVGAGIDITDTSGDITENLIENNDARGFGGGFFLGDGADVVVFRNILRGNTATTPGLGIGGGGYIEGTATTAILQFNRVTDNQAARHGSGYYAKEAMVDFLGELLHDNRCPEQGDGTGIWVDVGADVLVENATIADHPCPTTFQAQAILVDSADLVVRNSILWNNQGGDVGQGDPSNIVITYTINQSDHPGQGNQNDADPLFAAPADQDYHVRSIGGRYDPVTGMDVTDATSSPAIDAGDPASSVDLEPAPNGGIRNLGAYGGTEEASRSDP